MRSDGLDVSRFDTAKVTDMSSMFFGCRKVENIDCSNFNTSNVTNMASMFQEDWDLRNLDLSSFDTNNVTNMTLMFGACGNLSKIWVGNKWKVAPINTDMFKMCGVSDTELKT